MFSKIFAAAAIAGLASAQDFNAGDGLVTTVTTLTTQEITVTSCEPTVTFCPGSVTTTTYPVVTTLPGVVTTLPGAVVPVTTAAPVAPVATPSTNIAVIIVPSGATGTGIAGPGAGTNTATYNMPNPTGGNGGYTGPSFEGAGNKLSAGVAVGAVGAIAALLI